MAAVGIACEGEPTPTLSPGPVADPEEAALIRKLAFGYWEAFNAYDADRALAYLEEIGRIDLFNVQLGVSEEAPPWTIDGGGREIYLTMKEPLGTRRIRMEFRDVEGAWKITFAQQVE